MTDKQESGAVVGMKFHKGAQVVVQMLPREVSCLCIRDPGNKFDTNAIAVKVSTANLDKPRIKANSGEEAPDWFMIGHVDRESAARIAPLMDAAPAFLAKLDTSKGTPKVTITWPTPNAPAPSNLTPVFAQP